MLKTLEKWEKKHGSVGSEDCRRQAWKALIMLSQGKQERKEGGRSDDAKEVGMMGKKAREQRGRKIETPRSTDYWFEAEMGDGGSVGVKESSKQSEVRREVGSAPPVHKSGKTSKRRQMTERAQ